MEEKTIKGVAIHDSHGNVVDEAPIYPQGTEELVSQHNADQEAHPHIQEAITGLRTQVERRLVGAKVTFNDGHTEDVELGHNDQGEVILLLPKETFGKIDGVSVNGIGLEVDENGKVDITIPTTVHELDPDDAYATKADAQAMVDEAKVTGATLDYQEDGGSPSATVDFSEGSLGFTLRNMKMKFSDLSPEEIEAITGPQGIPGEGAIWTGSGEEIMTLAQETGNSIGKSMSQKAVTDKIDNLEAKFGAVLIDTSQRYGSTALTSTFINSNGKWDAATGSNTGIIITCSWQGKELTLYGSKQYKSKIAFLTSTSHVANTYPDYCVGETGRREFEVGATQTFTIPSDCKFIWLAVGTTNEGYENCYAPTLLKIESEETLASETGTEVGVDLSAIIADKSTYYFINSNGVWNNGTNTGGFYQLRGNYSALTVTGNTAYKSKIAFLKSKGGSSPDYCAGEINRRELELGETKTFTIPSDCKYVWFAVGTTYTSTEIVYLPQSAKFAGNVAKNVQVHDILNESFDAKSYSRKGGKWHPMNWRPRMYEYVRCGVQEAVPVGTSALSYDDFIAEFDNFVETIPTDVTVTKSSVVRDTMDTHDIYKYVFDPWCAKNTIFLTAGMHGNEYEGYWGLMKMLQYIYANGNSNDIIGYIRHNFRIIAIPVLNPYGVDNKIRYSTNTQVDQNYNFDMDWNIYTPHTGSEPWQFNEPKAVKLVCDEYDGEILFHIDYHTDPYSPTKANYIEADKNSIVFCDCYHKTIDERVHIAQYYQYGQITNDFVVWQNTAATSFRYMEVVRGIPSIIVESAPNGYAQSGSAKMMEGVVDWYLNCLCMMASVVI